MANLSWEALPFHAALLLLLITIGLLIIQARSLAAGGSSPRALSAATITTYTGRVAHVLS